MLFPEGSLNLSLFDIFTAITESPIEQTNQIQKYPIQLHLITCDFNKWKYFIPFSSLEYP